MDVLGVAPMKTQKQFKRNRRHNKSIKVVYISSPMKVKTSASEFRALVQELTGINSDAERFLEINGAVGDVMVEQMKSGVEANHESNDFNLSINSGFGDIPAGSSEYSSLLHLQAFGNNQSIFS